jgi:pimeloyl-ACP methyl ester carboxylesterase
MDPSVNFIREGEGAPVILIHGLAGSIFDWAEHIPALVSAGYSVYVLDLLGHGQSIKPKELSQYHIDHLFAHLGGWIDSLQLAQAPILIGHSLGGYLAIKYALLYPDRVRALVLADAFYSLDQLSPLLRFHYKRPRVNLGLISYAPEWAIRLAIELGRRLISNGYSAPRSRSGRARTAKDYKRASPGIYNILSTAEDLTPSLSQIKTPALIIWGARDQSLYPSSFETLATALPGARTAMLDAGHVPHQTHPAEFNAEVLAFLRSLEPSHGPAGLSIECLRRKPFP